LVATGENIQLDDNTGLVPWWWCVALCWEDRWSLLVILCFLMLRWPLVASVDIM